MACDVLLIRQKWPDAAQLENTLASIHDGELVNRHQGYAILVDEEFSCLEFYMNRDTISWILKKVGCLSEITAYLF